MVPLGIQQDTFHMTFLADFTVTLLPAQGKTGFLTNSESQIIVPVLCKINEEYFC